MARVGLGWARLLWVGLGAWLELVLGLGLGWAELGAQLGLDWAGLGWAGLG